MSRKVHRRDFVKYTVAGGGVLLGTEVASSKGGPQAGGRSEVTDHPWWVDEVDEPPLEIDDEVYQRFDPKRNVFGSFKKYVGPERMEEIEQTQSELEEERRAQNTPGFRVEDRALYDAAWVLSRTGGLNRGLRSWNRQPTARRHGRDEDERWEGTPEEAANLIKRAARFFGAASVGVTRLDRRHVWSRQRGREIVFEDVDEPYEVEGEKAVIPEKCTYAIAISVQMSIPTIARSPSQLADAASSLGYSRAELVVGGLAEFIRNLGHVAIPSVNDLGASVAVAVEAGLGELGRTNRMITPEYGPSVRLAKVFTDLPMATDKPIRFGVLEFCRTCKRCAEACPSKALSFKDEPDFETVGEWNNPGHQAWFEDSVKCFQYWQESDTACSLCLSVCPYNKEDRALVHSLVKAASAKAPPLDGFFTSMDRFFGYGRTKDAEQWWGLDLPEYGIDSTR